MRKSLFGILILAVLLVASCSRDCKKCRGGNTGSPIPIERIHSVNVNFGGTVYIYQDTFQMVSVVGPEAAITHINTSVKDGVWDLSYPQCLTCEEKIIVNIVVPEIHTVQINGSGKVIADGKIRQPQIAFINNGSGTIRVDDLMVDSLFVKLDGSGKTQISGEVADVINAELTGSGDIELYQFPGLDVKAKLTGSGNIFTTVINQLKALITGSGNVYYKGSPSIEQEVTGSGKVIKG